MIWFSDTNYTDCSSLKVDTLQLKKVVYMGFSEKLPLEDARKALLCTLLMRGNGKTRTLSGPLGSDSGTRTCWKGCLECVSYTSGIRLWLHCGQLHTAFQAWFLTLQHCPSVISLSLFQHALHCQLHCRLEDRSEEPCRPHSTVDPHLHT